MPRFIPWPCGEEYAKSCENNEGVYPSNVTGKTGKGMGKYDCLPEDGISRGGK